MLVVAESGSTKCDWLLDDGNGKWIETFTIGFNPFFHSTEVVLEHLRANPEINKYANQITEVYFYGAGCSSEDRNMVVRRALETVFTQAKCYVGHDLNAAAYATYTGEPAITCILGTGSNSCYFDGEVVTEVIPALGYILGDEGSGSYFGKRILSDYIYERLPQELQHDFKGRYQLTKEEIFSKVYNERDANVFLASFMRFLVPHKEHPYFAEIIEKGLRHFCDIHILCYPNCHEVPVHFVGSVSYYFQDILRDLSEEMGFKMGTVNKNPVSALLEYHRNIIQSV
jgi:glucosamine kinase